MAATTRSAGVLADSLRDVFPDKRPVFLVGILADKDYRSMLRAVAPLASAFVCVTPPNPRALDAVDLAETIRETCGELGARATIEVAGDFDDAASAARKIAGPQKALSAHSAASTRLPMSRRRFFALRTATLCSRRVSRQHFAYTALGYCARRARLCCSLAEGFPARGIIENNSQ